MRVFVSKRLRCMVILSKGYALVLRDSLTEEERKKRKLKTPPRLLIEFIPESGLASMVETGRFVEVFAGGSQANSVSERQFYGLLGVYTVKAHIYVGFITQRTEVGSAIVGEKIYRLENTMFISLKGATYDYYAEEPSLSMDPQFSGSSTSLGSAAVGTGTSSGSSASTASSSARIRGVEKLLASGTFYYSENYDMTSCLQERGFRSDSDSNYWFDEATYNQNSRYAWNRNMIEGLATFRSRLSREESQAFDSGLFLLTIIRGFAHSLTLSGGSEVPSLLTIISKQDCNKNGPLFGPYGMDDDGNATCFVETEMLYSDHLNCASFLLLRGNVPLFWELESQLLSTKIHFSRSADSSRHAFNRHFRTLVSKYGSIHIIDALSKKGNQQELSERYREAVNKSLPPTAPVWYSKADASKCNKKRMAEFTSGIMTYLEDSIKSNEAYACMPTKEGEQNIMRQSGTFLVNTLDANDRANFIESQLSEKTFKWIFQALHLTDDPYIDWNLFWANHETLWDANGRSLGKLAESYNNSLHTASKSGGIMAKVANQSVKYITPSQPGMGRQSQFDRLLGRTDKQYKLEYIDPIHDYVMDELKRRSAEYVSQKKVTVYACTYNVNAEQYDGDLRGLFFPDLDDKTGYDIVVVGLEEVVELTPSGIMSIDPSIRHFWEKKIHSTLRHFTGFEYTLIKAEKLGGLLEMVFVREKGNLQYIKDICTCSKKTGLKGMAANKGGVAIAFEYSKTKVCFVVSHLAAGYSNAEERHQDFKTLATGLRFRQNKLMVDYDVVLWMGDFNFRIDGTNEEVRPLVEAARTAEEPARQQLLNSMFEMDQLNKQMANGESFPYFDEMEIKFLPTYKFDKGTDVYDTSEKQRVPAWTDRILTLTRDKGRVAQLRYDCYPELRFSDHKPVFATFVAQVDIVDEAIKGTIERQLYDQRKQDVGGVNSIIYDDLSGSGAGGAGGAGGNNRLVYNGLPPPSNKSRQWWNTEGTPSRVSLPELEHGMRLNRRRCKNPFAESDQPDYVQ